MKSAESFHHWWPTVWHDLTDPFPGRLAQTWRIALACALTVMLTSVYGIPEAAISCYLIFFVMKPDAAQSMILACALTVLVLIIGVLLLFIVQGTINVPALRIVAIVVTSLILLYLGSASQLGELGGIIALVIAMILSLLDNVPSGELATRLILYAVLMSIVPMACVMAVSLFMGRRPIEQIRATITQRLLAAADYLEHPTPDTRAALQEKCWEGQAGVVSQLSITRAFALGGRAERKRLAFALPESYRLVVAVCALPQGIDATLRAKIAAQTREAAKHIDTGEPDTPAAFDLTTPSPYLNDTLTALHNLALRPNRFPKTGPADPFFRPDALTNPNHLRYAIKTTIAAVLCYFIYTAFQWQGIHTAMITCYVAALGSLAETTHKLMLRIIGCLIGAALGIGSILFIMPYMTSVGAIMSLVFFGTFLAAWIWVGNERVSYGGVQIALAFLLTVLQGFGPTFDMDTARDRIVGVLLGNCVLFLVFTQLWPVSVVSEARAGLQRAFKNLANLALLPKPSQTAEEASDLRIALAAKAIGNLADTRRAISFAGFENRLKREGRAEVRDIEAMVSAARHVAAPILALSVADPALADRLNVLADRLEAPTIHTHGQRNTSGSATRTTSASLAPPAPDAPHSVVELDQHIRTLERLVASFK